jgi:hypothetical protein
VTDWIYSFYWRKDIRYDGSEVARQVFKGSRINETIGSLEYYQIHRFLHS